jgi:hypothetical protein
MHGFALFSFIMKISIDGKKSYKECNQWKKTEDLSNEEAGLTLLLPYFSS